MPAEPPSPIHRAAARVLPVSASGRVLLLQARDPQRPAEPFWFSVGGALEPAETDRQGAVRELREETGIEVGPDDLGAPFAQGTVRFDWDGHDIEQDQVYFAIAVAGDAVSFAGHDVLERATIIGHGWWRPEELEASGAPATAGLAGLMRQAIRHLGGDARPPRLLTTDEALALRGTGWQAGPRAGRGAGPAG